MLATGDSNEIGRYDLASSTGLLDLTTVIFFPIFQIHGIFELFKELGSLARYNVPIRPMCLKIIGEMLSGPLVYSLP